MSLNFDKKLLGILKKVQEAMKSDFTSLLMAKGYFEGFVIGSPEESKKEEVRD
jgi:hypothetical protein